MADRGAEELLLCPGVRESRSEGGGGGSYERGTPVGVRSEE